MAAGGDAPPRYDPGTLGGRYSPTARRGPDLGRHGAARVTVWSGLAMNGAGMWGKRDDMVVHQEEPFNAEPPPAALAGQSLTPIEAFYSRNHGPFPDLDPASWRLCIDGLIERELVLTLADLQQRFPARSGAATLECGGNRRGELIAVRDIPGQVPWGPTTISTA